MNKYIIYTLILSLFISCELVVDIDLPEFKPSLVINGTISPANTMVYFDLSQDKDILNDSWEFETVSNADISLFQGSTLVGKLSEFEPGKYSLEYLGEVGKSYTIKAEKNGYQPIEATTTVPKELPILEVKTASIQVSEYGERKCRLTFEIDDKLGLDYYDVKLLVFYSYQDSYYDMDKDTVVYGEVVEGWTEDYFDFVGADFDEFEVGSDNHQFSDELFDGRRKEFQIEFYSYQNYYYEGDGTGKESSDTLKYILMARKLDEDYYKYLKSSSVQDYMGDSPFTEPVQVYSNIKNGYGIFGSFNSTEEYFSLYEGKLVE